MKWYIILYPFLILGFNVTLLEGIGFIPFALGIGGISSGLYFAKDKLKEVGSILVEDGKILIKNNVICYSECCNDRSSNKWINYEASFADLNKKIFGQHIALKAVTRSVRQHLKNENPPKALVLSFHGYTGVGKNLLSRLISKEIYRAYNQSEKSKFVHTLVATHFLTENLFTDRARLKEHIENGISNCERSLFIFDEVDKFPEKLLDLLIPYAESNQNINGHSTNKAIFLLLGNSGGDAINARTYELRSAGHSRDEITYHQFESILNSKAVRDGGLKNSQLIDRGVIDLFVPFLPLEREHIKLCIEEYLREHRNFSTPRDEPGTEFIEHVADQISYIPDTDVYSRFGCKRVSATVDILLTEEHSV